MAAHETATPRPAREPPLKLGSPHLSIDDAEPIHWSTEKLLRDIGEASFRIDPTISRDSTAGSKAEQDDGLAAVFKRHDDQHKRQPIQTFDMTAIVPTPITQDDLEPFQRSSEFDKAKNKPHDPTKPIVPLDMTNAYVVEARYESEPNDNSFSVMSPNDKPGNTDEKAKTSSELAHTMSATVASMMQTIQNQQRDLQQLQEKLNPKQYSTASVICETLGNRPLQGTDYSIPVESSFEKVFAVHCKRSISHCLLFRDCPVACKFIWSEYEGDFSGQKKTSFNRTIARGHSMISADLGQYLKYRKSIETVAFWVVRCPEVLEPRELEPGLPNFPAHLPELDMQLYILIVSPTLREQISNFAKFPLPGIDSLPLDEFKAMNMPADIGIIDQDRFYFHHRETLWRFAGELARSTRATATSSLADALGAAKLHWDARCDEAQEIHSKGNAVRWSLPLLFHPNQAVVARDSEVRGEPAVYITTKVYPTTLVCWTWAFDGHRFCRRDKQLDIGLLEDRSVRLVDMAVYPLEYATVEMINDLTDRAKAMWGLREQRFVCYTGWDANNDEVYKDTRFIVDVATYGRVHGKPARTSSELGRSHHVSSLPHEIAIGERMPQGIALLAMPPSVAGFDIQSKKWISLRVRNIKPVRFNKNSFSSLVLSPDTKELVHALVATQDDQDGPNSHNDMISGKGNGLILLLHGGPGTGKTLTAESVAEIAEKPLYRVTCGDIGTDPNKVEEYLNAVLYLGKTWNCVVLLDEADVFLEERDLFDLARNSLVSVFLRTLEYYDGILILTSNRVGTFDEAFASRIQVALHYPDLTRLTRKKIWQNFLDRIEEDESLSADVAEIADHIDELKELEMNGRQIRNAVNTARRLATFKKEKLAWVHVKQVVGIVGQFTEYLEKTHDSLKARDRARHAQTRY